MKLYKNAYLMYLLIAAGVLVLFAGCSRSGETAQGPSAIEVTARFTNPVEIEPQPSEKCIACHTKVNPITKLASEAVDSGHGGDGG